MARDYSSYLTTKPHGTAVMEPGDEAILIHGSDTIQSCLTPRVTEVKALLNMARPQFASQEFEPPSDFLHCSACGRWKIETAFSRDSRNRGRRGRRSECKVCHKMKAHSKAI